MKKDKPYKLIQDSINKVFKSKEKLKDYKVFRKKLLKVQAIMQYAHVCVFIGVIGDSGEETVLTVLCLFSSHSIRRKF